MASFTIKVVFFMMHVLAVQHVVARKPWNECSGNSRLGKPCQDDTGTCQQVSDRPGNRFGQMECVPNERCVTREEDEVVTAPGQILGDPTSKYNPNAYLCRWYVAPADRPIIHFTVEDLEIEQNGLSVAGASHGGDCQKDALTFAIGTYGSIRLCGTHGRLEAVVDTNSPEPMNLTLEFTSDESYEYHGFTATIKFLSQPPGNHHS